MALPELTAPPGTPAFKADLESFQPEDVYASFTSTIGHTRKRRVYTDADATIKIKWRLNAAQMAAVHAWAEDVLHAYTEHFSGRFDDLGPGLVWYEAAWITPFDPVPSDGGFWDVDGDLYLFGDPSDLPPLATSLALDIVTHLTATAAGSAISPSLELDIVCRLLAPTRLALDIMVSLDTSADGVYQREDTGAIEREDGSGGLGRE